MSKFVIKNYDRDLYGYYTGDKYRFQGETFAVFDRNLNHAKKYSSYKKAELALCKFNFANVNMSYINGGYLEIIEIKE